MTTALPYQDDLLYAWDRAMGIEWLVYFEFVHQAPILITLLDISYTSLTTLSVVAFFLLIVVRQFDRARIFLEAFFFTGLIAAIIGPLFPAKAAVVTLISDLSEYPNFVNPPGIYHMPHMEHLRTAEGAIMLHPNSLPGLVTFPSFHTAAGVLLICAFWRLRGFFLVLCYALVMIAATPIFGGHYFVDLIAGAVLAVFVMFVLVITPPYKNIFYARR